MRWKEGSILYPKIDMPGHFSAAIKVYPELSCTGEAGWGERILLSYLSLAPGELSVRAVHH